VTLPSFGSFIFSSAIAPTNFFCAQSPWMPKMGFYCFIHRLNSCNTVFLPCVTGASGSRPLSLAERLVSTRRPMATDIEAGQSVFFAHHTA
jgi:hypothetical protein